LAGDVQSAAPSGSKKKLTQPLLPTRKPAVADLTDTLDELLLASQQARDEVRARFWLARTEVARWRLRPMPEDFDRA
jgi:hypothetical protein